MQFIVGLILVILGTLTLVFAQKVYNFTGAIDFVEKRMPGYTQAFIKLVAVIAVLLGILIFTGVAGVVTDPLLNGFQKVFAPGRGQ